MLPSDWNAGLPQILLLVLAGAGAPLFALPGLLPEQLFGRGVRATLLRCAPVVVIAILFHLLLQAAALLFTTATLSWAGPALLLVVATGVAAMLPRPVKDLLIQNDSGTTGLRRFGVPILAGALAMLPFWTFGPASDGWLNGLIYTVAAGIGFSLLMALLEAVHARMETASVAPVWKGLPSLLLVTGLVVLSLLALIRPLL